MAQGGVVFAALLLAFISSRASAQGTGYWHTGGNKILDSGGTEVRIVGMNWYCAETPDYLVHGLWAQDYHTVLNTIKSLGYNVIRIPFSHQLVESNPVPTNYSNYVNGPVNQTLVGQTALADLDTIIAYAGVHKRVPPGKLDCRLADNGHPLQCQQVHIQRQPDGCWHGPAQ
jgi:endoglucanase